MLSQKSFFFFFVSNEFFKLSVSFYISVKFHVVYWAYQTSVAFSFRTQYVTCSSSSFFLNMLLSLHVWCRLCCMLSCFSHVQLFVTLWTVVHQVPSVHGILQARILGWVAMPFSRGSSRPMVGTHPSCSCCSVGGFFTTEPPGKLKHIKRRSTTGPLCHITKDFFISHDLLR